MWQNNSYSNWNNRKEDKEDKVSPNRKYCFICEGQNTERFYFKKLIDLQKELKISNLLDLQFVDKENIGEEEEFKTASHPKKLIECADKYKSEHNSQFNAKQGDTIIIVFDVDVFKNKSSDYKDILISAKNKNYKLGVTNPCFELFLLLHYENSFEDTIKPNYNDILENKRVSKNRRFIDKLFSDKANMNAKINEEIGNLAHDVHIAIKQEKNLNGDIENYKDKITSNIGNIIQNIINDNGK